MFKTSKQRSRSSRRSKQRRINKANRAAAEKALRNEEVAGGSSVKITEVFSDNEVQNDHDSKGIVCEVENDVKSLCETPLERKAKKKEALMQYFLPVYQQPRFLEVIKEESSDTSDRETKTFTEISMHSENIVGETNVELVFLQDSSDEDKEDFNVEGSEKNFDCSASEKVVLEDTFFDNFQENKVKHNGFNVEQNEHNGSENIFSGNDESRQQTSFFERNVNENITSEHNIEEEKELITYDHNTSKNDSSKQNANITQNHPPEHNVKVQQNSVSEHNVPQNILTEHNVEHRDFFDNNVTEKEQFSSKPQNRIAKTSALSPPRSPSLSSNGSSSRGTSLCTARYNPSIGDIASLAKDEELAQASLNLKQPSKLRELCLNFLLAQPFGTDVLKELANVSKVIDEFTSTLPSKVITSLLQDNVKQCKKDIPDEDLYLYYEENDRSRLQTKELTEWLELARNKSVSETNLTKISVKQSRRRTSLPNNFYQQQLILIQEKEREIQRQLEELEEEKRKLLSLQFTSNDNQINLEKKQPIHIKATPTEAEVFRQQMYNEYMQQLQERDDRRLNKVIKLSCPNDELLSPKESKFDTIHPPDIENEFMEQVKKRKLGGCDDDIVDSDEMSSGIFDSDSEPIIILNGGSVSCTKTLPRHIQEFAEGECLSEQKHCDNDDDDDDD